MVDKDSAVLPVEEMEQQLLISDGRTEEAEQPLLTPEEVMANLAARNSEDAEAEMVVEEARIVGSCHTGRAEVTTDEQPEDREVVVMTNEETEAEQAPPRDETARTRAATVHIYQRRSARDETSGRKSTEEQQKEISTQNADKGADSSAKGGVTPPHRKRRFIIVDEPEEEEDVVFTPLDALPGSEPPAPPAEVEGNEERRKKRKRKGKAIATAVRKKLR